MLGRPINIQVPLPKVWLATASGHLVHQLRGRAQLQLWRHAMIRKVHHYVASNLNDQHFLGDQSSIIGQAFHFSHSTHSFTHVCKTCMIFTALLLRENHDFPSSGFQNKTSFLFETSQPRISLFECWDESSSDHRDMVPHREVQRGSETEIV